MFLSHYCLIFSLPYSNNPLGCLYFLSSLHVSLQLGFWPPALHWNSSEPWNASLHSPFTHLNCLKNLIQCYSFNKKYSSRLRNFYLQPETLPANSSLMYRTFYLIPRGCLIGISNLKSSKLNLWPLPTITPCWSQFFKFILWLFFFFL